MSSAGHILDMIKRMRSNRSMKRSGKYFDSNQNLNTHYKDYGGYSKFTEEEKNEAREDLKQRAKTEKVAGIITFFILLFSLAFFYFYYSNL